MRWIIPHNHTVLPPSHLGLLNPYRRIDANRLQRLTHLPPSSKSAEKKARELAMKRRWLVDALYRKGRALAYMELPDVISKHPIANPTLHEHRFESNFQELARWVDTTQREYFLLHIRRERRQGRYGSALRLVNHHIPNSPPTFFYFKKRRDLYELAGWQFLRDYEHRWLLIRFPPNRAPF